VSAHESTPAAHLPSPPSERRAWAIACAICALGAAAFLLVITGLVGGTRATAPPPVPAVALTPAASSGSAARAREAAGGGAIVASPSAAQQRLESARVLGAPEVPIARRWIEGFYPIYETAQRTFGVNWLLLASIHMQESAFSTAPGTYSGLNFAHCCGGPMQFNVRNGRRGTLSTWALVSSSYIYGRRPVSYDHMTLTHPSIYDDFDAIMAAAHLLSADGASYQLDQSAWDAAYDYYGHDATGVLYADTVLARAIGWSQHGFCANCGVRSSLVEAVDAAYGAPVRAALLVAPAPGLARAARTSSAAPGTRR
jgi:hypothetical protein